MYRSDVAPRDVVEGARSGSRLLEFLEIVANSSIAMSITDIARQTSTNTTTAYRTMRVLEEFGFVRKDPRTRYYSVGPGLIALSATVMSGLDLRASAQEVMLRVRDRTGETLSLHIPVGGYRVCISSFEGLHSVRRVVPIGDRVPIWEGPSGKVILAHLPAEECESILSGLAPSEAESTRKYLELARKQGYLALVGDRTNGVGGLSVPVFDHNGIAGSFTVSGPADRWGKAAMEADVEALVADVRRLSESLGYVPDRSVLKENR